MNLIKDITYLKDVLGQPYIGLKFYKNEISLFLDKFELYLNKIDPELYSIYTQNRINRDGQSFHATILPVYDYNSNRKNADQLIGKKVSINLHGVGKAQNKGNTTFFIVLTSDDLDNVLNDFNLKRDFHITIGFDKKDVFGVSKGLDTLI